MSTRYIEREDGTLVARRGTTNRNDRGSSYARAARRAWLLERYRADVDAIVYRSVATVLETLEQTVELIVRAVQLGTGEIACRCYRCGVLLVSATITVDRIVPGCDGGTYRRTNIRPACARCNSETGGSTRRRTR